MDEQRETILDVTGMTCRSCVGHVNDALREIGGVSEVDVRLREGKVLVRHDADTAPVPRLIEALAEAGYDATSSA